MSESLDIKKIVDISPATLVKTTSSTAKGLMCILGVVVILFCVFFTVKSLMKPKPTQNIQVGQGGQVVIKNEANKRHLILFAEPYVGIDTKDKGSIGIRTGCRWEF